MTPNEGGEAYALYRKVKGSHYVAKGIKDITDYRVSIEAPLNDRIKELEDSAKRCPSCGCTINHRGHGHHSAADCIFMQMASNAEAPLKAEIESLREAEKACMYVRELIRKIRRWENTPLLKSIIKRIDKALTASPAEPEPKVDDLLMQEIYSLREKLKIAVAAIKSYDPDFDDQEFIHRLNSVDYGQLMEELNEKPAEPGHIKEGSGI
jgi:hypothetical protein